MSKTTAPTSRLVVAWVPLLGAAVLVGCAPAETSPPTYSKVDVAIKEYRAEAARLTLAPGWTWPKEPIPATYQGDEIRYETGYGTQAADRHWFCSWASRALATRPGTTGHTEAVGHLTELRDLYYFEVLHEQSKPYVEKELQQAKAGNLELVKTDVEQNCPARESD